MNWLKTLVRSPLRAAGYDLRKIGISPDPVETVRAMLAGVPSPVVFDVGANVGQSVERFRPAVPGGMFHCFEPDPAAFAVLERNTSADSRVLRNRFAVGEKASSLTLRVNRVSATNSFLGTSRSDEAFSQNDEYHQVGAVEVSVVTLDEYCSSVGVEQVGLLKIDVQGFEGRVLTGASGMLTSRSIRLVFLEANFVPLYEGQAEFDELMGFLRARGYKLVNLYDCEVHREFGLIQANALFCAR